MTAADVDNANPEGTRRNATRCNKMQRNATQRDATQHDATQSNATQNNKRKANAKQTQSKCNAKQRDAPQSNAMQRSARQDGRRCMSLRLRATQPPSQRSSEVTHRPAPGIRSLWLYIGSISALPTACLLRVYAVPEMTASERVPARPYTRNRNAVGDADIEPI